MIKILLVEDDPTSAEFTEVLLSGSEDDFDVETVETLADAKASLSKKEFDLILLDLNLPDSKGTETIEKVYEKSPSTPIVLLTSIADEKLGVKAIHAGANDYLVKDNTYAKLLIRSIRYAIERKKSEKIRHKLDEASKLYQTMFENTAEGIIIIDDKGIVDSFNPHAEEIFGYQAADVIGKDVAILMDEDFRTQHQKYTQNSKLTAPRIISQTRDLEGRRKDGSFFPLELNVSPMTSGDKIKFVGIIRDITERKKTEDAVLLNEKRFMDFANSAADRFWEIDEEFRFTYVSELANSSTRPLATDMLGKKRWEIEGIDPKEKIWHQLKADMTARKIIRDFQYRRETPNNGEVWINMNAVPYTDEKGTFRGYRGTNSDITERKKAQDTLEQSENRFRDFTLSAADRFWETDTKFRYTYMSPPMGRLTLSTDELTGKTPWEIQGAVSERWDDVKKVFAKEKPIKDFHYIWLDKDNLPRHLRMTALPFFDKNGKFLGYRGTSTDETSVVNAKVIATSAEQRIIDVVDGISDSISLYDAKDCLVIANQAMLTMFPEIIDILVPGTPSGDVIKAIGNNYIHQDEIEKDPEWANSTISRHSKYVEKEIQHFKDDSWCELHRYRTHDGGMLTIRTNVTERINADQELNRAKETADRANKAKSEFLASMSHELRTPMNAILGFAQLLENNPTEPLSEKQLDHTNQILKGGAHLLDLIDQVLELSKIEAGKINLSIENVAPLENIEECLAMVASQAADKDITLELLPPDFEPAFLRSDHSRLNQILLNLLSNAIKYNREGGRVTIALSLVENDYLRISITDTGFGIPEKSLSGIFEPFDRLGRETGEIEGTGIGLTITRQIVELLEGKIDLESEVDIGSTFWVELPLSNEQTASESLQETTVEVQTVSKEAGTSSGVILYIEDNPANLRLMEAIINRLPNLTMKSTHTAELGLEMARDIKPDIILMDINLPGMDGIAALKKLRAHEQTKNIPVIAISAAAMPKEIKRGQDAGFEKYITKPIKVPEVLQAIDENIKK